jgi:lipopolysaccharide export system permease protein
MRTLKNYIFKKLIATLVGLSGIFIGAIWLTQSLRLKGYLGLIVFLLPDLIATTLPICVLIAGIQVYQKFIADNELAIMRSIGLSHLQIAGPIIMLGFFASLISLIINLYIIPLAFQNFREKEYAIKNEISSQIVSEGAFNVVKGVTIYVRERLPNDEMRGIFIHQEEQKDAQGRCSPAYTVFAEKGQMVHDAGGFSLYLKHGHRQERNKQDKQLSFLHFEEFRYDLTPLTHNNEERSIKPYERTLQELLHPEQFGAEGGMKNRMIIEAHQRILMPFQSLLNAFILSACILYGELRRRRRKHKIIAALSISLCSQGVLISILNLATTRMYLIPLAYIMMFILLSIAMVVLQGSPVPALFRKRQNIVQGDV